MPSVPSSSRLGNCVFGARLYEPQHIQGEQVDKDLDSADGSPLLLVADPRSDLRRIWSGGALVLLVSLSFSVGLFAQQAPEFALPRRGDRELVRLVDFAGQIVVLDFFAYWCAPCHAASKALETEIQKYYAKRNGNAQGIPVRVVSINIEKDHPDLTAEFIADTGTSLVLEDPSASLLKQFGAEGIPYLVVIDGSHAGSNAPLFTVVYRHAGFEGAAKLRRLIDGIGRGAEPVTLDKSRWLDWLAGPLSHRIEADTEATWSSDILLTESAVRYEEERGRFRWDASFTHTLYAEDYRHNEPWDRILGFPEALHEHRYAGQGRMGLKLAEPFTLILSGGAYDGFQDYRRVWINNYYRQQYDHPDPAIPRNPGYKRAHPHGWNIEPGIRWEYLPQMGFLEVRGGYALDEVAPGYDNTTGLAERGEGWLHTTSLSLSTENVLSPRLRALSEVRFSDTTTREWRVSWQGALNAALGERWVLRNQGGYTREDPKFEAFWLGTAIEFELTRHWAIILSADYYQDTGEVLDPLVLSSAAPGLESWQANLGARFSTSRVTLRLSAGPYFTDYDAILRDSPANVFLNLYRDRNWVLAQAVVSVQF